MKKRYGSCLTCSIRPLITHNCVNIMYRVLKMSVPFGWHCETSDGDVRQPQKLHRATKPSGARSIYHLSRPRSLCAIGLRLSLVCLRLLCCALVWRGLLRCGSVPCSLGCCSFIVLDVVSLGTIVNSLVCRSLDTGGLASIGLKFIALGTVRLTAVAALLFPNPMF